MQLATPLTLCVLLAAGTWRLSIGQEHGTNLLANPSFEEPLKKNWKGSSFKMSRSTDAKEGTFSLKAADRQNENVGPVLDGIQTCKGCHYVFEGWVKQLNDSESKIWQSFKIVLAFDFDHGAYQTYTIVKRSFCNKTQGWMYLKGSIEAPQKETSNGRIAIRGPESNIDFLVDNLTLYTVPERPNWRKEADINIQKYRMSDIKIAARLPKGAVASDYELQVTMKRHLYPFGSLLRDSLVLTHPMKNITKLAMYMFNWATVQSYKWKFNKGHPENTNPDFSDALNLTRLLIDNGLKVRGHSIFWNLPENTPDWVLNVPPKDLRPVLYKHEKDMVDISNGLVDQMDIQNEHIAGHLFEEILHDKEVSKNLIRRAKSLNYKAEFFMNEYQCITSGSQTEQYYDLAMEYLKANVPIDGLGIQGHTKHFVKPDPTAMWRRIDRLGETGLKLMMTEFDIGWYEILERADWLEDSIRAFFGHPKMSGVILWDFYEQSMKEPDHGLVDGPDDNLVILEPGQRWICLVKKEWTTNETLSLADGNAFTLRAFQGDYDVVVKYKGKPVQLEKFTLGKENARWTVKIDKNTEEIPIPQEHDYLPQCISHREERSMGTIRSSSADKKLTCRTEMSSVSGTEKNANVSVSCEADEVMTGCSSIQMDGKWTRNGEKIEVDAATKKVLCTAFNGHAETGGVKAFARCCKVKGLKCDYKTAGPSFPFDGAMAEARCDDRTFALGCSTYSAYPDSDGVKPKEDLSSCVAQSGKPVSAKPDEKSGAVVYSACCNASPQLKCEVVASTDGKVPKAANIASCSTGYVLTACSAFAEDGKLAGARIIPSSGGDKCRAQLGTDVEGTRGVKAYATCCKV